MPTVPQYNRQVQEQGFPNVRVSAEAPLEAFGGGKSLEKAQQATEVTVNVLDKIANEERNSADQLVNLEMDKKLSELETTLLHHPVTGAMNKKGKDAFEVYDKTMDTWSKSVSELEKGLNGENQKLTFKKNAYSRQADIDNQLNIHMSREGVEYSKQLTDSFVSNEQDAASANFAVPDRVEKSILLQTDAIQKNASIMGLPPETISEKIADAKSKTRTLVIGRMLSGNQDMMAKKYFDDHIDDFTSDDKARLEKIIEEGSYRGESQRRSDELLRKYKDPMSALESARKIDDPELRDRTVERIKQHLSEDQEVKSLSANSLFERTYNTIEKTKSRDSIPDDEWYSLKPEHKRAIEARIKQLNAGEEPKTDLAEYYYLRNMAAQPSLKNKFLKTNLLEFKTKLAEKDWKHLVELQSGLRSKDSDVEAVADGIRSDTDIINQNIRKIGINPNTTNEDEADKINLLKRRIDIWAEQYRKDTGRKVIPNEELQKTIDNLLIQGKVDGSGFFFDDKIRAFEISPGKQLTIDVKDIPMSEKVFIKDKLNRLKMPLTDDNMLKLYNLRLQKLITPLENNKNAE